MATVACAVVAVAIMVVSVYLVRKRQRQARNGLCGGYFETEVVARFIIDV